MSARTSRLAVFFALYRKEVRSIFDAPTAYVVTIVLLLISGYLFSAPLFLENRAVLTGFSETAPLLFLFFVPAVTMRLYAEERKSGTQELLATLPIRDEDVLGAKYLSALSLVAFTLAWTAVYPATLRWLGRPDMGAVVGVYFGLMATGAVLSAIGIWASSMTRNQIVSFIVAFSIGFSLFLLGKIHLFVPPALSGLTEFLGLDAHLANVSRGVFDTRDLLYYASVSFFFLYLTYLNVRARRLRG
jgi:ABC-2 type transport system permease protein